MSERAEFHVMAEPFDGTPLHYTASGLDYVYLRNGFTVEEDPDYGRIVTIKSLDNLHRSIGMYVIMQPRGLTGAEFRFLRKQMKITQKVLAKELGVNEQTVANYEKDKPIPTTSENLMRMIFLLWIAPEDARADLVKRIAERIKARPRNPEPMSQVSPSDIQTSFEFQWQGAAAVTKLTQICHVF